MGVNDDSNPKFMMPNHAKMLPVDKPTWFHSVEDALMESHAPYVGAQVSWSS